MGFFSEVQSWFEDSGDFGGRYGQKIILEWEKSDKSSFKKFISKELGITLPTGYRLEQEYQYQVGRRADLAVIDGDFPILLVEIKWNDTLVKETASRNAQLDDYVKYCSGSDKCSLLVLTKGSLSGNELRFLRKLGSRGHHHYFGKLSSYLDLNP